MKKIGTLFNYTGNFKVPEKYIVLDFANVMCIEAISDYGKKILLGFIDEENQKEISVDYSNPTDEPKSKLSMDYVKKVIDVLSYSDSISLSVKKDYPVTFSNSDFKIILAPRIESED